MHPMMLTGSVHQRASVSPGCHVMERVRGLLETGMGCTMMQKHVLVRALGPLIAEIVSDSEHHLLRQGKPEVVTSFRLSDAHLAATPVNIPQTQPSEFSGAQTQNRTQKQHRPITFRAFISWCSDHRGDLADSVGRGQRSMLMAWNDWHRGGDPGEHRPSLAAHFANARMMYNITALVCAVIQEQASMWRAMSLMERALNLSMLKPIMNFLITLVCPRCVAQERPRCSRWEI